jgi:hypothetical protein
MAYRKNRRNTRRNRRNTRRNTRRNMRKNNNMMGGGVPTCDSLTKTKCPKSKNGYHKLQPNGSNDDFNYYRCELCGAQCYDFQ